MSKNNIVLASSNAGKLHEFQHLFADFPISIINQAEFKITDADETGLTFIENALIKARHASQCSGLPALADDSGLCISALNGAPGLYSARYAGKHGDNAANIQKVLSELNGLPASQRQAYFYCVLVFLKHPNDPTPLIAEGRWYGEITQAPQGDGGHGYDPIFLDTELNQTAAEMPLSIKNQRSHRGQALIQLKQYLNQIEF